MSRRWTGPLALAGVLLATGALYARVLDYPLLRWDDPVYVTSRPPLRRLVHGDASELKRLLTPRDALAGRLWEYYPLRDLSYALDALRADALDDGRPFHATNLVLHLLAALLVYALGRRLGIDPLAAALGAGLFALHPLAVEPVAWISGRKDLLYAALVLAALVAWLGRERPRLGAAGFGLAAIGAIASKGPGAIVVPIAGWLERRTKAAGTRRLPPGRWIGRPPPRSARAARRARGAGDCRRGLGRARDRDRQAQRDHHHASSRRGGRGLARAGRSAPRRDPDADARRSVA